MGNSEEKIAQLCDFLMGFTHSLILIIRSLYNLIEQRNDYLES